MYEVETSSFNSELRLLQQKIFPINLKAYSRVLNNWTEYFKKKFKLANFVLYTGTMKLLKILKKWNLKKKKLNMSMKRSCTITWKLLSDEAFQILPYMLTSLILYNIWSKILFKKSQKHTHSGKICKNIATVKWQEGGKKEIDVGGEEREEWVEADKY